MKKENTTDDVTKQEDTVVESTSALAALKTLVESNEAFDATFLEEVETIFAGGVKEAGDAKTLELEKANEETIAGMVEDFVKKADSYLTYAIEEWISDNELAVDTTLRSQISEDFLVGLKSLFTEQYVEMPEGKADLYDDAVQENERLNESLDTAESELAKFKETCESYARQDILNTVSQGMSDTDKERFESLIESVDYDNAEKYESKLQILRKAFIDNADVKTEDVDVDGKVKVVVEDTTDGDFTEAKMDPLVAATLAALRKK
jgi:hypothetical protein